MSTDLQDAPSTLSLVDLPPVRFLDASCNGMELSPAEFDAIAESDESYEYELLNGVVIVNPIPREGEADPNGHLEYLLRLYQYTHPSGKSLDQTLQERYVHLPNGSRRKADRVIWTGLGRRPNPKTDVPSIVVEFVSASKRDHLRDYVTKRGEYLAAGVREYWIIDRFRERMTVFRATDEIVIDRNAAYSTPLLPDFVLPLETLLEIADRWRDQD